MRKPKGDGGILRMAMLALCLLGLTGCFKTKPIILQNSVAIRILPGELPKSPDFKGWALSDQATARLLEISEACQGGK